MSQQSAPNTSQNSKAPKSQDSVSNSVQIVCEQPEVPKRASLKQRLTKSLKKSSFMKTSSNKQILQESKADIEVDDKKRENTLPDQDNPTSITLESKQTLKKESTNSTKESTSLVESSSPEHRVDSPKSLQSEVTAQGVHAHTGEIIPSSPPPPDKVVFPSCNGETDQILVAQEPILNNSVSTGQNQNDETPPPSQDIPQISDQNSTPNEKTQEPILNNAGNTDQNQNVRRDIPQISDQNSTSNNETQEARSILNNSGNTNQNQNDESQPPPHIPQNSDQNSTPDKETQEIILNNSENTDQNQNDEILPSSQIPPDSETQELILNNSENIDQKQSVSSPTPESVLTTLDKSIDAGNSGSLDDQKSSPLEAENVVCMNPGGASPCDDQTDVNNSTPDINLKFQDTPDDAGQKQFQQINDDAGQKQFEKIKDDSCESNEALEIENLGLNSTSIDNERRFETTKTTVVERLQSPQIEALEDAKTQTQNAPIVQTGTLETATAKVPESPPTPPKTTSESDRSKPDMEAGLKLSSVPSFCESILEGKDNLRSVSYSGSPGMRSKFYPAAGRSPYKAGSNEMDNSTKKNNNVKDLVSKFNQVTPVFSVSSSQCSSTDLGFSSSYVEGEIKELTASLLKNQYASVWEPCPAPNHQLSIPEISVRNIAQMFDSSDSSVATTPILRRKGSNVSVGYSPATNQTFRDYEGLHPYWSGSNTSGSDSDDSEVSFLPSSRRSSDNRIFSDFGSDLSNDTDIDVIRYVGEMVEEVINDGIIKIRDEFSNADTESLSFDPSPPSSNVMSETNLELKAQRNELSVNTVDFPAPAPLSHEDTVEDNSAPVQSTQPDLSTLTFDEHVNKLENKPDLTGEFQTTTTYLASESSEVNLTDSLEGSNYKSVDQQKTAEESNSTDNSVRKLERGKRSTIRRKFTDETKTDESLSEEQQEDISTTQNETPKRITRKRGSTIKRKVPLNKSASRTSRTSRSSVTSRTSQISEVGPDGIHYKPGFV